MTDAQTAHAGFPASTLVHTPDGLVPIGQLRTGDVVHSTDIATGETGDWPILETHAIEAAVLLNIHWGSMEREEGRCVAGAKQRFWVTPEEPAEEYRAPRDGPAPTWIPADGGELPFGSLRGWVPMNELVWGDEWITCSNTWAVAAYGADAGVWTTDRPNVAWIADYKNADLGAEMTFDAAGGGKLTKLNEPQTYPASGEETWFRSPTRQLTVDRGHSFHVLDLGLLAADFVNDGGLLVRAPD